jgi:outer membrane protein TolC
MKQFTIVLFLLLTTTSFSQEKLTLEQCYELVNTNYPLTKQTTLLSAKNRLDLAVLKTSKLPQIDFSAQASYQSDVMELPIVLPGGGIESPNKDQYNVALSVHQLIYGGGAVAAAINAKSSVLKTQQKQLEVSLYQLKKQVNQFYFSILLMQEKKSVLEANKAKIASKLMVVKSAIKYGAALPASAHVLTAETLKVEQLIIEVDENKKSLMKTLSELIGQEIASSSSLENPKISAAINNDLTRPELELFQLQKQQIDFSTQLMKKQNSPKLMGFGTGGYGNPGLNRLDNSFQPYYVVGLKLNWKVLDWSANQNKRKSLQINKLMIDNQQEVFKFNAQIEFNQYQSEIDKMRAFIISDQTIVELRKTILKAADAQLKNGAITSSAYLTELTHLFEAENKLKTHEIQLLLAKANQNTTQGN